MNTNVLALITAIAITVAVVSFLSVRKTKAAVKHSTVVDPHAIKEMSAEDLLELVAGVSLSELVADGDSIEITISTNGHPVAGNQYIAKDLYGKIKLTTGGQSIN